MRPLLVRAIVLASAFGWVSVSPHGQQEETQRVLAAAREAMGGDAALTAVKSFIVSGAAKRNLGRYVADQSIEVACQLPDRFVRVATYNAAFGAPAGVSFTLTQRDGFDRSTRIRETIAQGDLPPAPPPPGPPLSTAQREALERSAVARQQAAFARLAAALFATSYSSMPLEFRHAGPTSLDNGDTADVIDVTASNQFVFRLVVDASSHLPALIIWQEPVAIVATQTTTRSTVVTSSGMPPLQTPPPPVIPPTPPRSDRSAPLPPGSIRLEDLPPGASMTDAPLVEHRLSLGDYRVAGDVKWPHRFVESVDGQVVEDFKVAKYRLNPNIAPSKFRPAK